MKYRWITFDCYGTLIDWEGGMRGVFDGILEGRGLADGAALTEKYVQYEMWVQRSAYKPYREVLAAASSLLFKMEKQLELTPEEASRLAASLPDWRPFAEAKQALDRLKMSGARLAVLSNIDDDLLARSLERLGVSFDALVTAQQVGSYKPVTTHWREALRRFDVEPEDVLHVGASYLHDVMPAKQLGLDCVWINRKGEPFRGSFPPDIVLPDLSTLPEKIGA